MAWAKTHLRRVYAYLGSDVGDRRVDAAVRWIEKRGGKVTARDFLTYGVVGVKRASEVLRLFQDLQDRGWGTVEHGRPVVFCLAQ